MSEIVKQSFAWSYHTKIIASLLIFPASATFVFLLSRILISPELNWIATSVILCAASGSIVAAIGGRWNPLAAVALTPLCFVITLQVISSLSDDQEHLVAMTYGALVGMFIPASWPGRLIALLSAAFLSILLGRFVVSELPFLSVVWLVPLATGLFLETARSCFLTGYAKASRFVAAHQASPFLTSRP